MHRARTVNGGIEDARGCSHDLFARAGGHKETLGAAGGGNGAVPGTRVRAVTNARALLGREVVSHVQAHATGNEPLVNEVERERVCHLASNDARTGKVSVAAENLRRRDGM